MKNYSMVFKSLRLALICGATLTPLSQANAQGWNKAVDDLNGISADDIKPLRTLCNTQKGEKWVERSRRLDVLESLKLTTVEQLKAHLYDRKPKRGIQIEAQIQDLEAVRDFLLSKDRELLARLKIAREQGLTHYTHADELPTGLTSNKSRFIEIASQIQDLEAISDFLGLKEKKLLARLKLAQAQGLTQYTNENELPESVENSNNGSSVINIASQIQDLEAVPDYLGAKEKKLLARLKVAQSQGLTQYMNEDELPEIQDRPNSSPMPAVERTPINIAAEILLLEALLEGPGEQESKAQSILNIVKLRIARDLGITEYINDEDLNRRILAGAPNAEAEVVEEEANNNAPAAVTYLADQIELARRASRNDPNPEMRRKYADLVVTLQRALELGVVSYVDLPDLERQLEELNRRLM